MASRYGAAMAAELLGIGDLGLGEGGLERWAELGAHEQQRLLAWVNEPRFTYARRRRAEETALTLGSSVQVRTRRYWALVGLVVFLGGASSAFQSQPAWSVLLLDGGIAYCFFELGRATERQRSR